MIKSLFWEIVTRAVGDDRESPMLLVIKCFGKRLQYGCTQIFGEVYLDFTKRERDLKLGNLGERNMEMFVFCCILFLCLKVFHNKFL